MIGEHCVADKCMRSKASKSRISLSKGDMELERWETVKMVGLVVTRSLDTLDWARRRIFFRIRLVFPFCLRSSWICERTI